MYKIKIFGAKDDWQLEDRVNIFLGSEEFEKCVIISTEYKRFKAYDDIVFVLTYFDRNQAERSQLPDP